MTLQRHMFIVKNIISLVLKQLNIYLYQMSKKTQQQHIHLILEHFITALSDKEED